jgi:hypothetical protein
VPELLWCSKVRSLPFHLLKPQDAAELEDSQDGTHLLATILSEVMDWLLAQVSDIQLSLQFAQIIVHLQNTLPEC